MSLPNEDRIYTYADYLSWSEDTRAEIIDGKSYLQAAPSRIHQEILSELHRQIANYLVEKECRVYVAPFHFVLELEEKIENENDRRKSLNLILLSCVTVPSWTIKGVKEVLTWLLK